MAPYHCLLLTFHCFFTAFQHLSSMAQVVAIVDGDDDPEEVGPSANPRRPWTGWLRYVA